MAQQTAVEWLQECLDLHLNHEQKMQYEGLFQQAKQMEKEQIQEAWNDGNFLGRNGNILADYSDGNRYYKKEFENK